MKLRSVATEYEYTAYLTTEHACSSYGQLVCREGVFADFGNKKRAACTHGDTCRRLA